MSHEVEQILRRLHVKPVVGVQFHPMTAAEIGEVERLAQGRFPDSYRFLLGTFGACAFEHRLEFCPSAPLPLTISLNGRGHLDAFYGLEDHGRTAYSLQARVRFYAERMPKVLIPIADNGGGNQICLAIAGEKLGQVFYWDHEQEPLDEEDYMEDYGTARPSGYEWQNVHPVAHSFDGLLQQLDVASDE